MRARGNPTTASTWTRGIDEGFLRLVPQRGDRTDLTKQAMEKGILYDHLLDPETRARIELLAEEQKIELERLNKRVLSGRAGEALGGRNPDEDGLRGKGAAVRGKPGAPR